MRSGQSPLLQVVEGVAAVRHRLGPESFERQQLRHHLPQVGVVFDNEDGAVPGEAWTALDAGVQSVELASLATPRDCHSQSIRSRAATSPSCDAMIRREALDSNSATATAQRSAGWPDSRAPRTAALDAIDEVRSEGWLGVATAACDPDDGGLD